MSEIPSKRRPGNRPSQDWTDWKKDLSSAPTLKFNDILIKYVPIYLYLGIILDLWLNWSKHCGTSRGDILKSLRQETAIEVIIFLKVKIITL